MTKGAADHAVGFATLHHDRRNRGGVGAHDRLCQIGRDALTFHQAVVGFPVVVVTRIVFGVHDLKIDLRTDFQASAFATAFDDFGTTDEDRGLCGFLKNSLSGTQNAFVFALGEYDATRRGAGGFEHGAHEERGFKDRPVEAFLILRHIVERGFRDAGFHRGLCHSGGHNAHETRVEGFGDQVVGAKGQFLALIRGSSFGAGGCAGEGGDAFNASDLHFVVDLCRAHVEGTAEDEREAEHVVHLVRVVRTACRDDRIGRCFAGEVG